MTRCWKPCCQLEAVSVGLSCCCGWSPKATVENISLPVHERVSGLKQQTRANHGRNLSRELLGHYACAIHNFSVPSWRWRSLSTAWDVNGAVCLGFAALSYVWEPLGTPAGASGQGQGKLGKLRTLKHPNLWEMTFYFNRSAVKRVLRSKLKYLATVIFRFDCYFCVKEHLIFFASSWVMLIADVIAIHMSAEHSSSTQEVA